MPATPSVRKNRPALPGNPAMPSPIRAIRRHENVSVDLEGGDPGSGWTEMALRELGAERIIYGSDAGGRSFASQLAKVFGANISESAKKLILGENLKRMMMPILKTKGVSL
jgi:predicted TIM-barrel fold metal-dependent hydrolase